MVRSLIYVFGMVFCSTWLVAASCQRKSVIVGGHGTGVTRKESNYREQAEAARGQGDQEKEARAWAQLLQEHPQSQFSQRARLRLGSIAYERKEWGKVVEYYSIALKNPLQSSHIKRTEVVKRYGLALFHLKKWRKASQALSEAYATLSSAEKEKIRDLLIESARKSGNGLALIRWRSKQIANLSPHEQVKAKQDIRRAIDEDLHTKDLLLLYNKRGDKLVFPYGDVALRLARSYFHQKRYDSCQEILRNLLGELSSNDPLFLPARDLLKDLHALADQPDPTTIGVILPRTGRYASYGPWIQNAIRLATRGIRGIKIVWEDSQSDPKVAKKAVEKLVYQSKAIAIFGPIAKDTSLAAAYRAQELGVPLFSLSSREKLTDVGSFIFRNNLTLSRMGRAMARYAVKREGLSRFAIFYPHSTFGHIQVKAFWEEVERLGAKVVGVESYAPDHPDLTKPASRLVGRQMLRYRTLWFKRYKQLRGLKGFRFRREVKNLQKQFEPVVDFDAIFIPETYIQAAKIAPTLAQQDIEVRLHYSFWEKQRVTFYRKRGRSFKFVQLLGTNSWNNEKIFEREPRHVVGSIFCARYFPRSNRAIVRNFIRNYRRFHGQQLRRGPGFMPPIQISAYAYDTMKILIRIAKSKAFPKTRDAFRRALLQIKHFNGVTGNISIQSNGEALARILYLVAHRRQKFQLRNTARELIP